MSDESKRYAELFQHHTTQKVIKDATDLEHKKFKAEGFRRRVFRTGSHCDYARTLITNRR